MHVSEWCYLVSEPISLLVNEYDNAKVRIKFVYLHDMLLQLSLYIVGLYFYLIRTKDHFCM